MTIRISNPDAKYHVTARTPFKGSNLFAENATHGTTDVYVVYSYGKHFPLYVAVADRSSSSTQWFQNCDKYSQSTALHLKQAAPSADCTPMDTQNLLAIVSGALAGVPL